MTLAKLEQATAAVDFLYAARKQRPAIIRVDDFLEHPESVRHYALAHEFETAHYEGHDYEGICQAPLDLAKQISEAVGFRILPRLSFFRIGVAGDRLTVWIHADSICAQWASILYLTPHPGLTGTAFWRHRPSGRTRLPDNGVSEEDAKRLNQDGQDETNWEMTDFVWAKFNRFIAYPTAMFHSRYPRDAQGSGQEDGRLIWVCFFDEG